MSDQAHEPMADEEGDPFDTRARRILARGEQYALGYLSALLEQQHVLIQCLNERDAPAETQ